MGYKAKDGVYITATDVVRLECSQCGVVSISRWSMNDREAGEAIKDHALKVHGGRYDA